MDGEDVEPSTTVEEEGEIVVEGRDGCAQPGDEIGVFVESDPVLLGTTQANANGAYRTGVLKLPAGVSGSHTISVHVNGVRAYAQAITVDADALPQNGFWIDHLTFYGLLSVGLGLFFVGLTPRPKRGSPTGRAAVPVR